MSKHVGVVGELSRIVSKHKLMAVSEVEQDIVAGADRTAAFKVRGQYQGAWSKDGGGGCEGEGGSRESGNCHLEKM